MSKTKFPRPEVTSAYLPSAGISTPTWTAHEYCETRECMLEGSGPDNKGGGDAYEYVYRCLETGAERRWGTADRRPQGLN